MRFLIPLLAAFVLSLAFGLVLAKIAPRIGLMDVPDRSRKIHPRPVPLVGGLAIWLAMTVTTLGFSLSPFLRLMWWSISLMGLVGLIDDWVELPAWRKLSLQFGAAALLWFLGIYGTTLAWTGPMFFVGSFLCVTWILFVTNIINYTDNCNGLCGGLSMIILAGYAWVLPWAEPRHFLLLVAAAVGGVLILNFPRGRIFLGDAGSHLLGVLIAILSLAWLFFVSSRHHWLTALLDTVLFLGVPLADFVQVTVRRFRRGQSIWVGDTTHLSHLLIGKGFTPVQAVVILWLATAISVFTAVVLWKWDPDFLPLISCRHL